MKRFLIISFFQFFLFCGLLHSEDEVVGFWKTINEETGKAESIIGIYEYQGKYYGRLIATYDDNEHINDTIYNPKTRAPGVEGDPFYSGLDIIWNMKYNGSKYTDGKIMDPEKGKVYNAEMWPQNGKLIVRGKIWIFGQNQEWVPALDKDFPPNFKKPDLTQIVPMVPTVKKKANAREAKK